MSSLWHKQLRAQLETLRSQINELAAGDPVSMQRLNGLIADIERRLEYPPQSHAHTHVLASLEDTIHHFEVEHPRATAILNDIMVTLANMGI
ncbi:MAG: DUF4404 family protein [Gammaproteobacteria bacterium]